jgi:two-component system chemotaxis response regulator CheY
MKKILLVSESREFLDRNTKLLLNRGSHVFTATSGAEALRQHEERIFDLILSDFKLKDMDGNAFCSLLRENVKCRELPLILVCSNIHGSIESAGLSGATTALLRPVDPGRLIETLGRFIGLMMRGSKRVVLRTEVTVQTEDMEFTSLSHDISNTGILLESEHELSLGSSVRCRFTLPGSSEIEAAGEVVRSISTLEMQNFYGVKFIDLPLPYWREIDSYIAAVADLHQETQV